MTCFFFLKYFSCHLRLQEHSFKQLYSVHDIALTLSAVYFTPPLLIFF